MVGNSHQMRPGAPCVELGGCPVLTYKMSEGFPGEMPDTLRMTSGKKNLHPPPLNSNLLRERDRERGSKGHQMRYTALLVHSEDFKIPNSMFLKLQGT